MNKRAIYGILAIIVCLLIVFAVKEHKRRELIEAYRIADEILSDELDKQSDALNRVNDAYDNFRKACDRYYG